MRGRPVARASRAAAPPAQVRGRVHVPVILPHFTSKRVLTMEFIEDAAHVCDVAALRHMGVRPVDVARLARARAPRPRRARALRAGGR